MKLYVKKKLDYGFIILCHDNNIGLLKSTANSIKRRYEGVPYICITEKDAKTIDIKSMKDVCPTFKGKSTFSSLINSGMKNTKAEWNFIVFAGTTVRSRMDEKFFLFINSKKDVLFPIADNKTDFVSGTLNGLLLNKETFKEIGDIEENGSLDYVKTMWACEAIQKGCNFKAIANTKIC
jgi:hypothetical protein